MNETTSTNTTPTQRRLTPVTVSIAVVGALLVGVVARGVMVDGSDSVFVRWLPWLDRTPVTFYFGEADGEYLVPVSRTVSKEAATPEALVDALLAGPTDASGLTNLIPAGTVASSITFEDGVLVLDLSGTYRSEASPLAHESVLQSLRSWPGVAEVVLTVDGVPLETNSTGHLLYFYDEQFDRLVAQPTNRVRLGDVLLAWLEGPADPELVGLPSDIESLGVELAPNELLTLEFTFRESLREYAIDHPESMRRVLEALIATFNTGFPEVGGVLLDFEGHNALGLGQCANLLNTVQGMPEVLNDERVLARFAEA